MTVRFVPASSAYGVPRDFSAAPRIRVERADLPIHRLDRSVMLIEP